MVDIYYLYPIFSNNISSISALILVAYTWTTCGISVSQMTCLSLSQ